MMFQRCSFGFRPGECGGGAVNNCLCSLGRADTLLPHEAPHQHAPEGSNWKSCSSRVPLIPSRLPLVVLEDVAGKTTIFTDSPDSHVSVWKFSHLWKEWRLCQLWRCLAVSTRPTSGYQAPTTLRQCVSARLGTDTLTGGAAKRSFCCSTGETFLTGLLYRWWSSTVMTRSLKNPLSLNMGQYGGKCLLRPLKFLVFSALIHRSRIVLQHRRAEHPIRAYWWVGIVLICCIYIVSIF